MPLPLQGKTLKNSVWENSFIIPEQGGIVFVNMQELCVTILQDLDLECWVKNTREKSCTIDI
jgi:hypothetical protein